MEREPVFLNLEVTLQLHADSLDMFGGTDGIRDQGLIESALASARNSWLYGRSDTYGIAAAYAYHLAESQAFLDGNKRTGVAAALTFLAANGEGYITDNGKIYTAMIAIAERRMTKPQLAELLRTVFRETSAPET